MTITEHPIRNRIRLETFDITPGSAFVLGESRLGVSVLGDNTWTETRRNLWTDPAPASINGGQAGLARWFRNSGSTPAASLTADGWAHFEAGATYADRTITRGNAWGAGGLVVAPNTTYTLSLEMRSKSGMPDIVPARWEYQANGTVIGGERLGTFTQHPETGRWYWTFTTTATTGRVAIVIRRATGTWLVGDWYDFRRTLLEAHPEPRPYFDPNTQPSEPERQRTRWLGPVAASASVLETSPSDALWRDWTPNVINIATHRGGGQDGITVTNGAGVLSTTLRDVPLLDDNSNPILVAGQRLILSYIDPTEQATRLFTGRILDLDPGQVRVGNKWHPVVIVTAVDAYALHENTTRYGAMPPTGTETFTQRIERLTPTATAPIERPTDPALDTRPLGRTVYEGSLASHFDLACNTARAMWWIGPDNVTRFKPRTYDPANEITFILDEQINPPADALHVIRETRLAGTRAFFNAIDYRLIGAEPDPDSPGNWIATETYEAGNPLEPAATIYGRRGALLEINPAPDADILNDFGWVTPFTELGGALSSIVWNAQENLDRIPDLEIGASVYTPRSGSDRPYLTNLIIGVHHTITPTRWLVEITLIGT